MGGYVHGYSKREEIRLQDQADAVRAVLHHDTSLAAGQRVLEVGCGVGAQATANPLADLTSIDISETSIRKTRQSVYAQLINNVRLGVADVSDLPFQDATFYHGYLLETPT